MRFEYATVFSGENFETAANLPAGERREFGIADITEVINTLGQEGWELVSVIPAPPTGPAIRIYWMKRAVAG